MGRLTRGDAADQVESSFVAASQPGAGFPNSLAETRATRDIWDRRVVVLRNQSLDPDMIEERARALLHVAWPDDIVVFTPTR